MEQIRKNKLNPIFEKVMKTDYCQAGSQNKDTLGNFLETFISLQEILGRINSD